MEAANVGLPVLKKSRVSSLLDFFARLFGSRSFGPLACALVKDGFVFLRSHEEKRTQLRLCLPVGFAILSKYVIPNGPPKCSNFFFCKIWGNIACICNNFSIFLHYFLLGSLRSSQVTACLPCGIQVSQKSQMSTFLNLGQTRKNVLRSQTFASSYKGILFRNFVHSRLMILIFA